MKRGIFALTTALAVLALAGAGFGQTVTITCRCVADGVNSQMVQWIRDYVIPEFEAAKGGDVSVELTEFGGTDEAMKEQYALDLSVGGGADVLAFDGFWVPEFVAAGLLEPLSAVGGQQAEDWEGWGHIPDGLEELLSYEGERYGIALGTDYRMFFYRKDMLEQAGVENADDWQPQSWEDVLDAARKVKQTNNNASPLQINAGTAMGEATTMQGYFPMLLGTGHFLQDDQGRWIVRSQGILDTLELYKTIYVDEQLGDSRLQLTQDGRNRTFANFRDGNTAILLEGDYFYRGPTAPDAEFEVANRDEVMGWAAIPAMEPGAGFRGQDFVTISGGTGFVVNPKSANRELAWELLAFMNSQESLAVAQETQPRIRVRDDVPVPDNAFLTNTAAELGPFTTARPNDPDYPQISYEAQLMTERVVSGEMTPEEAMEAYARAVTDIVGADNVVDLN
ncbi:MAG: extracellular solute-binding protein [Trueperaceae bacterium]